MGARSRTKGASGELELARLIHDHLGVRLVRRLEQTRAGGHDLEVHPDETGPVADQLRRYAIECKRACTAPPAKVSAWWAQTASQAAASRRVPCLAYRIDRQDWTLVVPMRELAKTMPAWSPDTTDYCAALTLPGWISLIREGT